METAGIKQTFIQTVVVHQQIFLQEKSIITKYSLRFGPQKWQSGTKYIYRQRNWKLGSKNRGFIPSIQTSSCSLEEPVECQTSASYSSSGIVKKLLEKCFYTYLENESRQLPRVQHWTLIHSDYAGKQHRTSGISLLFNRAIL